MSNLVPLGRAEDIKPGAMASYEVGSKRIAVARVANVLYAFDDICTHEYCLLSEGFLERKTVICPCHLAEFDIETGRVLAPPATEDLAVYGLELRDGELLLNPPEIMTKQTG